MTISEWYAEHENRRFGDIDDPGDDSGASRWQCFEPVVDLGRPLTADTRLASLIRRWQVVVEATAPVLPVPWVQADSALNNGVREPEVCRGTSVVRTAILTLVTPRQPGRVFVSYVSEDAPRVRQIVQALEEADVPIWMDAYQLKPGLRWKSQIREAIRQAPLALLCISEAYCRREKTYFNEELTLMIEELRLRRVDRPWLLMLRLEDCQVPDRPIGAGETLDDLQRIDAFPDLDAAVRQVANAVATFSDQ